MLALFPGDSERKGEGMVLKGLKTVTGECTANAVVDLVDCVQERPGLFRSECGHAGDKISEQRRRWRSF